MLLFAAGSTIWCRSFVRVRDMEKVIVLLGVYNGAKYLQQQLDSLYRQQGVEVSILARDDGSTDESRTILEQNAKAHTLTWFSTVHRGVADGFYELMEKACEWDADYYAFWYQYRRIFAVDFTLQIYIQKVCQGQKMYIVLYRRRPRLFKAKN